MKIAVIGTGTAGILSIAFTLSYFDPEQKRVQRILGEYNDWFNLEPVEVYSIYDPNKAILGIGESTSTQIPSVLSDCIDFSLLENSHELDATIKLGVKFSNWRENDFYSHIMPVNYAMHFNNHSIKDYTFNQFRKKYQNFYEILGNVDKLVSKKESVSVIVNDINYNFDYVIDCRGYPDDYTDYDINRNICLNKCLVYNTKPKKFNYTHHTATPNGWMFGIPLQSRLSWGYLYNDTITSTEDAVKNFKTYCSDIDISKLREFSFKNYSARTFFDGRVLKNGNRALFYEPMEAFMGYFYDRVLRYFFDYVHKNNDINFVNQSIRNISDNIELALCFIYYGGSIYNTSFWEYAKKVSYNKLLNNSKWQDQIKAIKNIKYNHPNRIRMESVGVFPVKSWLDFDKNLKYNMF